MFSVDLKPEQFNAYPPQARDLAVRHVETLRRLPLAFLPSLLREVIDYDFRFPAERRAIDRELAYLAALSLDQSRELFQSFGAIQISVQLEHMDWVNAPAQFVEQLSAHLWSTDQLDAFRNAATEYATRLHAAVPTEAPPVARLGITVIGQGATSSSEPLFRKLRPHGAYFSSVKAENGLATLLSAAGARAKAHPVSYGHWYIDGGASAPCDSALTQVSYRALQPARATLSARLTAQIEKPGMGPEALRTLMAQMAPADLGFASVNDAVLDWFKLKVLTEGSGTQIFSTTFAQWAAREALRRAQPVTLLVRFAPRQRQKPMNEMLAASHENESDPLGSLVDGDFGAYYNWLNQQRLSGAERASFLAWFEDHADAVVIGPTVPRGTTSAAATTLGDLLTLLA